MSQQSLFSFAKPSAVELHVDHQDNYLSPPSSSMFEVSSSSTENSTGIGMKRAYEKEGNSGGGKRIKVDKFQYSWNKRWPWLLFKEDLGMFCKLCTSIYPLDLSDRIESEVSSLKISYLENIIANLKKPFPEEDTALPSKFNVLNPTTWPANSCQLKSFGTTEIIHLSKHFQEYIPQDLEDIPTQWHMFVSMVYENYSNSLTSFKMLADLVFNRLCVPFPSILYKIAAVLCISSADCERGFSVQNIIKTHKRSSLKTITVQRLQMIKLEGPSIHDFDFHTALLKFKLRKERRNRKKNT